MTTVRSMCTSCKGGALAAGAATSALVEKCEITARSEAQSAHTKALCALQMARSSLLVVLVALGAPACLGFNAFSKGLHQLSVHHHALQSRPTAVESA
eukprot:1117-Heterococcus_DN1.PRE.10